MNLLLKAFFGTSSCPIVIAQYERDDYSVDNVEQLHWAIIILTNSSKQQGPSYQATDRHYNDGRVEWNLHCLAQAALGNTSKCLGGVCIGKVTQGELFKLGDVSLRPLQISRRFPQGLQVVSSNKPSSKFPGWNCRDWVMETIDLMHQEGWVKAEILEQSTLYPAMKQAGLETKEGRKKGDQRVNIIDLNSSLTPFQPGDALDSNGDLKR